MRSHLFLRFFSPFASQAFAQFVWSYFWAFRNTGSPGSSKTRLKQIAEVLRFSAAAKKKSLTTYVTFFSPTAPLGPDRSSPSES
jgi:hypothetical protein